MRRYYFDWAIAVFGIFGTIYGGYMLVYHLDKNNKVSALALTLLILGVLCLIFSIALYTATYFAKKKRNSQVITEEINNKGEEHIKETPKEKVKETPKEVKLEEKKPVKDKVEYVSRSSSSNRSSSIYDVSTVYVKQVGYGPLLRVDGNRIYDMRNNVYYRIECNIVKLEGSGPVYEIRGNQIKNAFGGYLYELSGSNINKVFGGFYASISGNYITLYDLSVKYEMTGSLSKSQILAISALLFGKN